MHSNRILYANKKKIGSRSNQQMQHSIPFYGLKNDQNKKPQRWMRK